MVGSPKGRPTKSTPTGSLAGTGPSTRDPTVSTIPPVYAPASRADGLMGGKDGSRTRSYTCVVKPAGTVITGKPCAPRKLHSAVRPFTVGSIGAPNLGGGMFAVG